MPGTRSAVARPNSPNRRTSADTRPAFRTRSIYAQGGHHWMQILRTRIHILRTWIVARLCTPLPQNSVCWGRAAGWGVTDATQSPTSWLLAVSRLDKINAHKYCPIADRECRNRSRSSMWERLHGASAISRCNFAYGARLAGDLCGFRVSSRIQHRRLRARKRAFLWVGTVPVAADIRDLRAPGRRDAASRGMIREGK